MEKFCSRCNFRNPITRAVCQICGYKKFIARTDVPAMDTPVVNPSAFTLPQVMQFFKQTMNLLTTSLDKLTQKESTETSEITKTPANADTHPARLFATETPTFSDGEDLDSMIAWFKTYGVDRPLILDRPAGPSVYDRKAA